MATRHCPDFPGHPGTARHTPGDQMPMGPRCQPAEAWPPRRLPPPQLHLWGRATDNAGEMHFCTVFIYWLLQGRTKSPGKLFEGFTLSLNTLTPPTLLALSSCPGPAGRGSPPSGCRQAEFWGLLRLGLSISFGSVLTKLQLGFSSSLGGCQGEQTKQCRTHLALPAAKAPRGTASALPSKRCPASRAISCIWDGDSFPAAGGTGDVAKGQFLHQSLGFPPLPIPRNPGTESKNKNEHCTQMHSYNKKPPLKTKEKTPHRKDKSCFYRAGGWEPPTYLSLQARSWGVSGEAYLPDRLPSPRLTPATPGCQEWGWPCPSCPQGCLGRGV